MKYHSICYGNNNKLQAPDPRHKVTFVFNKCKERFLFSFEFILRPLGNCDSGRMDDDGMNWWNEESGGKREHTVFVHHKAHMAWAGFEPTTLHTRGERSTYWATAAPSSFHLLLQTQYIYTHHPMEDDP